MLPSSQRLSRQQVTELLANKGLKVIFNRLGTFKYINSQTFSLTVVTGSKQQKKAVLRNNLRRRIYSVSRQYADNKGFSGMIYVSKQSYEMSFNEIKQYLYELFQKISTESRKNT